MSRQDSSGSVVIRIQVLDMCGGIWFKLCLKKFFDVFCAPVYPLVTALLEYLYPAILHVVEDFVITP